MNTSLENRVQRTVEYLSSERGRENWLLNIGRGFNEEKNLFAAIQTATHLIKYETIMEVLNLVRVRWSAREAA